MRDEYYYSIRVKKRAHPKFNLERLKDLFFNVYDDFGRKNYFLEYFGSYSFMYPSGHSGNGKLGMDYKISFILLVKTRTENLWPIIKYLGDYTEDDLFNIIEFLFDYISKPVSDGFDKKRAQKEYIKVINEILEFYIKSYELSKNGNIVHKLDYEFETLISTPIPSTISLINKDKINLAVTKFKSRHIDDRKDAIRELADILEDMRPVLKEVLDKKDESDLFNLMNNFGIRHHNSNQQTDYDKSIFYNWMFYHFLSAIYAASRLIEQKNSHQVCRL